MGPYAGKPDNLDGYLVHRPNVFDTANTLVPGACTGAARALYAESSQQFWVSAPGFHDADHSQGWGHRPAARHAGLRWSQAWRKFLSVPRVNAAAIAVLQGNRGHRHGHAFVAQALPRHSRRSTTYRCISGHRVKSLRQSAAGKRRIRRGPSPLPRSHLRAVRRRGTAPVANGSFTESRTWSWHGSCDVTLMATAPA